MDEVRIISENEAAFFADALDMARRLDAGERARNPSVIAFESMEMLLKVLTPNRWVLLRSLRSNGPSSIRNLAHVLKRDYRGVHADVAALVAADLIRRTEDGKIIVPWSRITAEMIVDAAA